MSITKRIIIIISTIIGSMLILPLIAVHTVRPTDGMAVVLLLFFILNPIISIITGFLSGKDVRHFWYTPIMIAILFWVFSSLTFQTAFPIIYSIIYFVVSAISMIITHFVVKNKEFSKDITIGEKDEK